MLGLPLLSELLRGGGDGPPGVSKYFRYQKPGPKVVGIQYPLRGVGNESPYFLTGGLFAMRSVPSLLSRPLSLITPWAPNQYLDGGGEPATHE